MLHVDFSIPWWLAIALVTVVAPACQWAGRKSGDAAADAVAALWHRLRGGTAAARPEQGGGR